MTILKIQKIHSNLFVHIPKVHIQKDLIKINLQQAQQNILRALHKKVRSSFKYKKNGKQQQ